MSLEHVEELLKQRIGLHSASVGRSAISSAVGRRMATCKLASVHAYCDLLRRSDKELDELIETVVIPETWFFRDGKPFQVLRKVAAQLQAARPRRQLRALSIPCSTGEEPYSIAMILLEAGLSADRIQVDAVDISRRALEFARAGSYGSHSFRGDQDARVLERHFQRDGTRFNVSPTVRGTVNFAHGNLLTPGVGLTPGYDVIFCRNLMIYFDEHARKHAYRTLHHLLAEQGLLFVGHAECGTVPTGLFHNAGEACAFAFRRGAARTDPATPRAARITRTAGRRGVRRISFPRAALPAPTPKEPDGDPLELARQLTELGRLAEAREICQAHLRAGEQQAHAYFLLGAIRAAEGNAEASEEALRRAIYLDPKHHEALLQLARLLEKRGERAAAERMHRRAERAAPQKMKG